MDKFWSQYCPRTVKSIRLATCFVLLGIFGAAAQGSDWSFEDNPQPAYEDMTGEEKLSSLIPLGSGPGSLTAYCENVVQANYRIYQDRYPDFQNTGNLGLNFNSWKIHIVATPAGGADNCILSLTLRKLISLSDPSSYPDFYFCGVFSRPPETKQEREIWQLISELVDYANTGSRYALNTFMEAVKMKEIFNLNPDVEYYFRSLKILAEELNAKQTQTRQPGPLLSKERRAFVERAADNFDYQAVLDTTRPCRPR